MNQLTEQQLADQDLDMFLTERDYTSSQKKRTEVEWLVVFPEAKKRWSKIIRAGMKLQEYRLKKYLEVAKEVIKAEITLHYGRKDFDSFWPPKVIHHADGTTLETIEWLKESGRHVLEELERQLRKIKSDRKLMGQIGNIKKKLKHERLIITPEMIQRAKEYPIEKLVEMNRGKFTLCFGHQDKKPSAYCKNNFIHCFVCQKSWDTIAVLMERDGMKFREAVLQLQ